MWIFHGNIEIGLGKPWDFPWDSPWLPRGCGGCSWDHPSPPGISIMGWSRGSFQQWHALRCASWRNIWWGKMGRKITQVYPSDMKCKWNQMFTIQNTWDWLNPSQLTRLWFCLLVPKVSLFCGRIPIWYTQWKSLQNKLWPWFDTTEIPSTSAKTRIFEILLIVDPSRVRIVFPEGSLFVEILWMKAYEGWIGLMQRYPSTVMPWRRVEPQIARSPEAAMDGRRSHMSSAGAHGRSLWGDGSASTSTLRLIQKMQGIRIPSVYC